MVARAAARLRGGLAVRGALPINMGITDRRWVAAHLESHAGFRLLGRESTMTNVERKRYREIATEIRALFPMLKYPEALEELRLLAARYERLAKYLKRAPATPLLLKRQAG